MEVRTGKLEVRVLELFAEQLFAEPAKGKAKMPNRQRIGKNTHFSRSAKLKTLLGGTPNCEGLALVSETGTQVRALYELAKLFLGVMT